MSSYHDGSRRFQDRFDTRRLADRIEERFFPRPAIDESDRAFIGIASHSESDPLLADYPEALFVTRVEATEVFPNCPRYIHHYRLVERSRFVPKEACKTPVPAWKTREWAHDVLRRDDPAYRPDSEVVER